MLDATLPGYFKVANNSFIAANATNAKILFDVSPAQVVSSVPGEVALSGEATVRQRVLMGGAQIIDGQITSTDGSAKSLLLYVGKQVSAYADMGTVATTATTNATLARTVGSFIADGITTGDSVMLFGCSDANSGKLAQITNVTATTLTFNGVGAITAAETMAAGFRVIKVTQDKRLPVPANSGNTDSIVPVKLINNYANDSRVLQTIPLGANDVLIGAMVAAVSALPARVDIVLHAGLY